MTTPVPRIFVSHSHKDDAFTTRLVADLRTAGAQVWVDDSAIQHGSFMRRISDGLEQSEWLVLVPLDQRADDLHQRGQRVRLILAHAINQAIEKRDEPPKVILGMRHEEHGGKVGPSLLDAFEVVHGHRLTPSGGNVAHGPFPRREGVGG
jgi:hypothetical protein